MTGTVEWTSLLAFIGLIITITVAVTSGACFLLYRALKQLSDMKEEWSNQLSETRHTINSKVEQGRIALEAKIDEAERQEDRRFSDFDVRLRKVESEHILVMALREDFRTLQKDLTHKLEQNRLERRDDMRGLHDRLNEILMLPTRHPREGAE